MKILQAAQAWLGGGSSHQEGVLWIEGPAGVGKSTIMQTLAESEPASRRGATFFFSRFNNWNKPQQLFATLGYQLAVGDRTYRDYLTNCLYVDPQLINKSLREQFRLLIEIPFTQAKSEGSSPNLRSILLDGLDECDSEQVQCDILELIISFALRYPESPIRWVISSRPEQHLKRIFSQKGITAFWQLTVPMDSDDAFKDVEQYLRDGFHNILRSYIDSFPPHAQWPTESQFLVIANATFGSFAVASLVLKFVGDLMYGDPVTQLESIISFIHSGRAVGPFMALDALYFHIMNQIPYSMLSITKRILGYCLLSPVEFEHPFVERFIVARDSFWTSANILGITQSSAYGAVHKLHSVLDIPSAEQATFRNISFFHTSFGEFLYDPARSQQFYINLAEIRTSTWWRYHTILRECNFREY